MKPTVTKKTTITADQITQYGKSQTRSLHLEPNVIAYFGQLLLGSSTVRSSVTGIRVNGALPK
jgi:hypothetical protein